MRNVILSLVAVIVLAAASTCPAQTPRKINDSIKDGMHCVGVSLGAPDLLERYGLNQSPTSAGTQVHFVLVNRDKNFIRMDLQKSKIESAADDKGTDLTKNKYSSAASFQNNWVGGEGHAATFTVSLFSAVPAAGASQIKLKGTLALVAGSDLKEETVKDVELKQDTKIEAGGLKLTITKAGTFGTGMSMTVESDTTLETVKDMVLVADGKDLPITSSLQMDITKADNKKVYTKTFYLPQNPAKATLKIRCYGKTEQLTVPLDATVGLGSVE